MSETLPKVSIVMPCYNEEEAIEFTIPELCQAFEKAGHAFEVVGVDNGSRDDTAKVLQKLADRGLPVRLVRVEVNQGYGFGLLSGIPHARGEWVGFLPADGQCDPEDVVRLYEAVRHVKSWVLAKVRRRFRMDGLVRKAVSVAYNAFVWMLWPRLGSIDVNGTPKMMRREVLDAMELQSHNWLFDPEMMVKAHYLGVRVMELNAFARMRGTGLSHVRVGTCFEFFKHLLRMRFSRRMAAWRRANHDRLGAFHVPRST